MTGVYPCNSFGSVVLTVVVVVRPCLLAYTVEWLNTGSRGRLLFWWLLILVPFLLLVGVSGRGANALVRCNDTCWVLVTCCRRRMTYERCLRVKLTTRCRSTCTGVDILMAFRGGPTCRQRPPTCPCAIRNRRLLILSMADVVVAEVDVGVPWVR